MYQHTYHEPGGGPASCLIIVSLLTKVWIGVRISDIIISTVSMVVALRRMLWVHKALPKRGFVIINRRCMRFWVIVTVPTAESRYDRTRVILSRLHCTMCTYNMAAATLNLDSNDVTVALSIECGIDVYVNLTHI